jgi:hypothetical protein
MIESRAAPKSEMQLHRSIEAAGSSFACPYECSAELHAEAVSHWRWMRSRQASLSFHALGVAGLILLVCLA